MKERRSVRKQDEEIEQLTNFVSSMKYLVLRTHTYLSLTDWYGIDNLVTELVQSICIALQNVTHTSGVWVGWICPSVGAMALKELYRVPNETLVTAADVTHFEKKYSALKPLREFQST